MSKEITTVKGNPLVAAGARYSTQPRTTAMLRKFLSAFAALSTLALLAVTPSSTASAQGMTEYASSGQQSGNGRAKNVGALKTDKLLAVGRYYSGPVSRFSAGRRQ